MAGKKEKRKREDEKINGGRSFLKETIKKLRSRQERPPEIKRL